MEDFTTLGEITHPGRPDFYDNGWGKTQLKRHPQYVYSTGHKGQLIHKISHVTVRWWQGSMDRMVRLRKPVIIAETICGMSKFVQSGGRLKASMCEIPKPDAVMCKRCLGEALSTFPRRDPTSKHRA